MIKAVEGVSSTLVGYPSIHSLDNTSFRLVIRRPSFPILVLLFHRRRGRVVIRRRSTSTRAEYLRPTNRGDEILAAAINERRERIFWSVEEVSFRRPLRPPVIFS